MSLRIFSVCKVLLLLATTSLLAQDPAPTAAVPGDSLHKAKEWYQRFGIRGYAQVRYNRLGETNPQLKCQQCDASWGEDGGFFLRRARVIIFGQVHKQVYFYIQPDFASSAGGTRNYGQIRDIYFDVGLDQDNEFRFRIGQSKVPFGFENLQSSQNRLPLDRNDGLNSALSNERDIGVFFYWAPKKVRERFRMLVRDGYKGSGDYGVFGFGAFNGQTANQNSQNDKLHLVARLTYPFEIGSQIIEPSIQAYKGDYTLRPNQISDGVLLENKDRTFADERVAATFVMYPRPFGIQAEYNWGRGPQFNPHTGTIETSSLEGGYVTLNYRMEIKDQLLYPFTRYHYYDGGKKHELDARSHKVNELEIGAEWLPFPNFELVAMYTVSSRRFEDFQLPINHQRGGLIRIQAQMNF